MNLIVLALALITSVLALARALRDHAILKNRLREMEQRAAEVARQLRERGNLANELAHEIKNPISAILCSAEALDYMIGKEIDDNHRKCLAYIKEYGENLLHLIEDFIDLSRAEAGRLESHPEKLSVQPLVESIVGLLQHLADKKRVTLGCIADEKGCQAFADPRHVKQILFNLVHNAIKFTAPGGEVQISVARCVEKNYVSIAVKDNGCGISADRLSSIFDPYVRAPCACQPSSEGLGLGLAVCRALAAVEHGSISVQSEVGLGSRFELRLPAGEEAQIDKGEFDSQCEVVGEPLAGRKFLLVAEDAGLRGSVAALIKTWGGMIDEVDSATQAVQAVKQAAYDAVMLDKTADGLLGYEVAKLLQEDLEAKETTVIVASKDERELKLAKESGADKCIVKPLSGKVLLPCLLNAGRSATPPEAGF